MTIQPIDFKFNNLNFFFHVDNLHISDSLLLRHPRSHAMPCRAI